MTSVGPSAFRGEGALSRGRQGGAGVHLWWKHGDPWDFIVLVFLFVCMFEILYNKYQVNALIYRSLCPTSKKSSSQNSQAKQRATVGQGVAALEL